MIFKTTQLQRVVFSLYGSEMLTAGSRVLLAVTFVFLFSPQRRPAIIAVAVVGALSLAICAALLR